MVLAVGVAFYEQTSKEQNIYVMVIAFILFMFGMMRLSSKTPSKNTDNNTTDV